MQHFLLKTLNRQPHKWTGLVSIYHYKKTHLQSRHLQVVTLAGSGISRPSTPDVIDQSGSDDAALATLGGTLADVRLLQQKVCLVSIVNQTPLSIAFIG